MSFDNYANTWGHVILSIYNNEKYMCIHIYIFYVSTLTRNGKPNVKQTHLFIQTKKKGEENVKPQ